MEDYVAEAIVKERKTNQAQAVRHALKKYYADQNCETWVEVGKSLTRVTQTMLNRKPYICTIDEELWYSALRMLLADVVKIIKEERSLVALPPTRRFWFDINADINRRARKLVAEYPGETCPITVL